MVLLELVFEELFCFFVLFYDECLFGGEYLFEFFVLAVHFQCGFILQFEVGFYLAHRASLGQHEGDLSAYLFISLGHVWRFL